MARKGFVDNDDWRKPFWIWIAAELLRREVTAAQQWQPDGLKIAGPHVVVLDFAIFIGAVVIAIDDNATGPEDVIQKADAGHRGGAHARRSIQSFENLIVEGGELVRFIASIFGKDAALDD